MREIHQCVRSRLSPIQEMVNSQESSLTLTNQFEMSREDRVTVPLPSTRTSGPPAAPTWQNSRRDRPLTPTVRSRIPVLCDHNRIAKLPVTEHLPEEDENAASVINEKPDEVQNKTTIASSLNLYNQQEIFTKLGNKSSVQPFNTVIHENNETPSACRLSNHTEDMSATSSARGAVCHRGTSQSLAKLPAASSEVLAHADNSNTRRRSRISQPSKIPVYVGRTSVRDKAPVPGTAAKKCIKQPQQQQKSARSIEPASPLSERESGHNNQTHPRKYSSSPLHPDLEKRSRSLGHTSPVDVGEDGIFLQRSRRWTYALDLHVLGKKQRSYDPSFLSGTSETQSNRVISMLRRRGTLDTPPLHHSAADSTSSNNSKQRFSSTFVPRLSQTNIMQLLRSNNWEIKMTGISHLLRQIQVNPDHLERLDMKELFPLLGDLISSPRPILARHALQVLTKIFQKKPVNDDISVLLPHILRRTADTNSFFRVEAVSCLDALVRVSSSLKTVKALVKTGASHQLARVRAAAAGALVTAVEEIEQRHLDLVADTLYPVAMKLANDQDPNTRQNGLVLLEVLQARSPKNLKPYVRR